MAQVDAVVGNSSSGLYEAPSLAVATVNIGDRQLGRLAATSVIHCAADSGAIGSAIRQAMSLDCRDVLNPYGDGATTPRILAALRRLPAAAELLRKPFFMLP